MEPKNKLVTIDGEEIVIGGTYWSPYSYATYTMTAEIFNNAIGSLRDLEDYDGYFQTFNRERNELKGLQVWFKFDDGNLLDQTRLASLANKEARVRQTARNHGITVDEARDRFYPMNGVTMKDLR
jgi:hypothetical protein